MVLEIEIKGDMAKNRSNHRKKEIKELCNYTAMKNFFNETYRT